MDLEDLLYIGGFALTFFLGAKAGEKRATETQRNEERDREIRRLQFLVEELKQQKNTEVL